MKKRRNKHKVPKDNTTVNHDLERYDVEVSDDGLDTEDRILLDNARGRKRKLEEEEVLGVDVSSSSESEEYDEVEDIEEADGDESEEESDEDGESVSSSDDNDGKDEGLPDSTGWGLKRHNYYHTDYVDKDFLAFDDEEAALNEEVEAKVLQERLLNQIEGSDFTLGLFDKVEEKKKEVKSKNVKLVIDKKIATDRTKLTEVDLKEFDERETPGFNRFLKELRYFLMHSQNILLPLIELYLQPRHANLSGVKYLKSKYYTIWSYSMNFTYLLFLKTTKTPNLDKHPVIDILNKISIALRKLEFTERKSGVQELWLNIVRDLAQKKEVTLRKPGQQRQQVQVEGKNRKERRKLLQLIAKRKEECERLRMIKFADEHGLPLEVCAQNAEKLDEDDSQDENIDEEQVDSSEKRPATYQMIKNKGLTPKRKKEMRNPRVRNKNKFKKAVVRRKGQVKMAIKEINKYDGEISGIKKNLSRSIKLK